MKKIITKFKEKPLGTLLEGLGVILFIIVIMLISPIAVFMALFCNDNTIEYEHPHRWGKF